MHRGSSQPTQLGTKLLSPEVVVRRETQEDHSHAAHEVAVTELLSDERCCHEGHYSGAAVRKGVAVAAESCSSCGEFLWLWRSENVRSWKKSTKLKVSLVALVFSDFRTISLVFLEN